MLGGIKYHRPKNGTRRLGDSHDIQKETRKWKERSISSIGPITHVSFFQSLESRIYHQFASRSLRTCQRVSAAIFECLVSINRIMGDKPPLGPDDWDWNCGNETRHFSTQSRCASPLPRITSQFRLLAKRSHTCIFCPQPSVEFKTWIRFSTLREIRFTFRSVDCCLRYGVFDQLGWSRAPTYLCPNDPQNSVWRKSLWSAFRWMWDITSSHRFDFLSRHPFGTVLSSLMCVHILQHRYCCSNWRESDGLVRQIGSWIPSFAVWLGMIDRAEKLCR